MGKIELIFGHDDLIYLFQNDKCIEIFELKDLKKATNLFEAMILGF